MGMSAHFGRYSIVDTIASHEMSVYGHFWAQIKVKAHVAVGEASLRFTEGSDRLCCFDCSHSENLDRSLPREEKKASAASKECSCCCAA
jgi:hypothetical protein